MATRPRLVRGASLATTVALVASVLAQTNGSASPPAATPAGLQIVHDRRGDSKSGVPGNDIIRATARLANGEFRFTITNVRIPQGLFPPVIDFKYHGGVGGGGQPVLDDGHGTHRIHRHYSGNTVVYSFKRKLLGRIDEKYLQWRAAIFEQGPSDLAPDRGYAKLRVH